MRMTKRVTAIIIVLLVLGAAVGGWFVWTGRESGTPRAFATITSPRGVTLRITSPAPGEVVTSPLVVTGEVPGPWYFEASFPIALVAADGTVLNKVPAQAEGDWITTEYVPFEATISFDAPEGDSGTLVFEKDNASGLPEHDDTARLPIRFR